MENEARDVLKQHEEKIFDAVHKSPLSIAVTSAIDHRYIEVNETFEHITGWGRSEVLGRTPYEISLWVNPGQRTDFVNRLLSGDVVHNIQFQVRTKNGDIRTGLGSAALVELNGETCIVSLAADITDVSRADELISSPLMICMCDANDVCTYFNHSWLDFTGRTLAEARENGWTRGIHPEDLKGFLEVSEAAFKRRGSFQAQFRLRRYDDDYRRVLLSALPRFHHDGSFAGYIGAALDITESEQAETLLSKVTRTLIHGQEEERARIGRELHGYVDQLTLLSIDLDRFDEGPPLTIPEFRQKLAEARNKVEDLIFETQHLSQTLYSSKLKYLGIAAAARGFCEEFSERMKLEIDFRAENIPEGLPQKISLALFRVLQELLRYQTTTRHAKKLQVLLQGAPYQLQLILHGDTSLAAEETLQGAGPGLTISKERLKLVGGEFSIETQPGGGTTIRARVPLKNEPEELRRSDAAAHVQ